MSIENFFTIVKSEIKENKYFIDFTLNTNHNIYKGHFPEQPIVPGVMQIQIIKELLSDITNSELQLKAAGNIKYLGLMIPEDDKIYHVEISYELNEEYAYKTKANIKDEKSFFLKFSGTFQKAVQNHPKH